jgi:diguanylate cyclase (GGDEF)-like protein
LPSLLAVSDRPQTLEELTELAAGSFAMQTADLGQARAAIEASGPDVLAVDGEARFGEALALLAWARRLWPATANVVLTGCTITESATAAVAGGLADACVLWPCRRDWLLADLSAAARRASWQRRDTPIRNRLAGLQLRMQAALVARGRLLESSAGLLRDRVEELEEEARRLRQHALRLYSEGRTDHLTGLPNRRAIEAVAERELARRARHPAPLALGLVDADHFKDVNRAHLHTGGDRALVCLARAIRSAVRATDTAGRIGGEEFLLLCPDTDTAGATVVAERVRAAVEREPIIYAGTPIALTVSVGMAVLLADTSADLAALTHHAARHLADAKQAGRNRCVVGVVG